jgi:hypothetical protein
MIALHSAKWVGIAVLLTIIAQQQGSMCQPMQLSVVAVAWGQCYLIVPARVVSGARYLSLQCKQCSVNKKSRTIECCTFYTMHDADMALAGRWLSFP